MCCIPAVQFSFKHLKSNLSFSGHQTISKCQWWISIWDAWQSGVLLMYHIPLFLIWSLLRFWVCCCSVPLCETIADLQREGEEAWARWEPIWTDPTSCQLSPQWLGTLPTHQQPSKGACPPAHPKWAASSMSPSPHYWQKKRQKQGAPQSSSHPKAPRQKPPIHSALRKFNKANLVVILQI